MEMKERCMVEGITELSACKVGLVGFGDIARAAAERLVPFGCELYYYTKHRRLPEEEKKYHVTYLPWEELAVLTQRLFLGGMPAAALSAAPEGLTMELQQCTTTGAVVVLQNAAEETFSYGADYGLYRQVNGGWYQMNKEMDTIAIAYELAPGESRKLTLSWGELDWGGVLPAGTYCVAQGGLLGEQQVTVSVTFAIK